jgi:hypothetical protein
MMTAPALHLRVELCRHNRAQLCAKEQKVRFEKEESKKDVVGKGSYTGRSRHDVAGCGHSVADR